MQVFSNHIHGRVVVLILGESVLVAISVPVANLTRFAGDVPAMRELAGPMLWQAVVFAFCVVLGMAAMGLYQRHQRLGVERVIARVAIGVGFAAIGSTVIYFVVPTAALGRGAWAIALATAFMLLATSRSLMLRFSGEDVFRRRVLIYGAGARAASLLKLRRRADQRDFKIIAFLTAPGDELVIDDPRVDHSDETLVNYAKRHAIDEIVVAMDDRRRGFPFRDLLDAKFAGIAVMDILGFLERESGRFYVELMEPSRVVFSRGFTRRRSREVASRLLDIAAASVLLLVTWPFILVTALAILALDGRPILYRQTRVGLMGKPFVLFKFRSMRTDAEESGSPKWAEQNDQRVTRTGALTRKLRLDELPQIFNIIRGDMSLVGPRPERPEFVQQLSENIPYYQERHCVKPGLTGWAQLRYSYGASEQDALEKLRYDLYYVKNQSLLLDLMILLQTVEVVVWRKGSR